MEIGLEHPGDLSHGDFSTNIALTSGVDAKELVEKIKKPKEVEKIEIAGPGFINFHLNKEFLVEITQEALEDNNFGNGETLKGKKVLMEHTSPNAFKPLHIGHFMANAIGEAIARLLEASGARVERATYGSDIGLPTAKAVWGMLQLKSEEPEESASLERKMEFIGNAYAHASALYESDPEIKKQIDEINIHIYKKDEEKILSVYQKGRRWSLEYLEKVYKRLNTKFDHHFFESEVFEEGSRIVKENLGKVFEESEGAIIFRGEDHGLHTRVFVTSKGAPTYEAKEIGLHQKKSKIPFDISIVVTGNEQSGVMEVGLKAFEQIDPETAKKTEHISHGLMLGKNGKKLSSRKGSSGAEELVDTVKEEVLKKIKESDTEVKNPEQVAEDIAMGALKYQILKQGSGRNIIFDLEQSLSFEGDSGPYLQYTLTRINSLLEKAKEQGINVGKIKYSESGGELLKTIYRFPEIVERAANEYAPQYVTTYLINLASAFNSFYAQEKIIDTDDKEKSSENLALTWAVSRILKNGLGILNIATPERM